MASASSPPLLAAYAAMLGFPYPAPDPTITIEPPLRGGSVRLDPGPALGKTGLRHRPLFSMPHYGQL
jgi:hypothetical protein